jgi:hypothetical protein
MAPKTDSGIRAGIADIALKPTPSALKGRMQESPGREPWDQFSDYNSPERARQMLRLTFAW